MHVECPTGLTSTRDSGFPMLSRFFFLLMLDLFGGLTYGTYRALFGAVKGSGGSAGELSGCKVLHGYLVMWALDISSSLFDRQRP